MLSFASHTWDGWDYVPHAWPVWLAADDGVLLVATAAAPADGSPALDRDGRLLEVGRPLALARVAMLSTSEAWLEGIRVDPRVRGMDVATDLQVAELAWARAQHARLVRYATGGSNEGSHRLGARHGFELLTVFRTYWWSPPGLPAGGDEEADETGFDQAAREAANRLRAATLDRLAADGLVAQPESAPGWWRRVSEDLSFNAGERLYEHRAWALQELSPENFRRHVVAGEVLVADGPAGDRGWALALLERTALPAEDVALHLGLVCGEGAAALDLLIAIQAAAGGSIRFRLPSADPPLLRGRAEAFASAGFRAREWTLDILARPLNQEEDLPRPTGPRGLIFEDEPSDTVRPPHRHRRTGDMGDGHRVR